MNYVIMPIYCGTTMTRSAIESVLHQDAPTHLFAVLNGATDGAQSYVQSLDPHRVTYVSYQPQKGVSYAWNRALEWVFGRGAESVLVVNNDIVLRPDTYRLLLADGGEFVTGVGSSDPKCIAELSVPTTASRPHPDFSCFLIRRSTWERIGQFDESMVNYCSDGDMHLRLHRSGIEAYCIDLPFYHRASGTLKELDAVAQAVLQNQAEDDRKAFERKWGCAMGSPEYYAMFQAGPPPASSTSDPKYQADYAEALDRVKIGEFLRRGIAIRGVIHAGANDGYEVYWYLRLGIANVLAIEPLPSAAQTLRDRFGEDARVQIIEAGLGYDDCTAMLHVVAEGDGKGSAFLREKVAVDQPYLPDVECSVRRFDSLAQADALLYNCLVLDVQGMELEALQGMGALLTKIDCINVECSAVPIYDGEQPASKIIAWLGEHGFVPITPVQAHDDILFVRQG